MRKGKIHYIFFAALAIAGAALTACSSDDINKVEANQKGLDASKTYYMSVDATKGNNEAASRSNRALTLSGSTLSVSWATNEHVYVQGAYASGGSFLYKGDIQPQSAGSNETILNGTITVPDEWAYTYKTIQDAIDGGVIIYPLEIVLQFPRSGELNYTGQVGTLADIAEKYDYAIATDAIFDIKDDHIVGTKSATFINQQAIVKFTLKDKADGTTLLSPTALTVNYGSGTILLTDIPNATYSTNTAGVLYVAIPGFSGQDVTLTATVGADTYTYNKSSVTFENGRYYDITVKMTK